MGIVHVDVVATRAPVPTEPWATKTAFEILEDMLAVYPIGILRELLAGTPAAAILEKTLTGGFDS